MRPNFIDRVALQLAPGWGMRRIRARLAAQQMRHYEAAMPSRRTNNWTKIATDANAANLAGIHTMRNLARDLVRNNGWARRGKQVIGNNTVGWGMMPTPVDAGPRAQKKVRDLWRRWAGTTQCDVNGQRNMYGLQRLAIDTINESGEVLVRRYRRSPSMGLTVPVQLQVLEPDYLDTWRNVPKTPDGGQIIQGVEYDAEGKRVAYWMFPRHPGASFQFGTSMLIGASQRIPAEDIIHAYYIDRPGQVRGMTWWCAAIVPLKDYDEFEDAQLLRQKIAACFAAFVTDADGSSLQLGDKDADDALLETIEPGSVLHLPTGKQVTTADPPQVTEGGFDQRMLRKIAASIGVTYEDLTGDYGNVNFSSARMARLAHWANVYDWEFNMLIPMFCDVVWRWAMEASLIGGAIGETPAAEWTTQPMPMIDPDKEARAALLRVRAGQASPDDVVRELGLDPETFWPRYAESFKRLDSLGIVIDADARKRTQLGQPTTQTKAPASA